MLAQKVGRQIIPVVEKYTELHLILKYASAGRRAAQNRAAGPMLASRGSGAGNRRAATGPSSASPPPRPCVPAGVEGSRHGRLPQPAPLPISRARSQTSARIKGAVNEAVRVYVTVSAAGAGLKYPRRGRRPSASITDGSRPISNPASTIPSRNTPKRHRLSRAERVRRKRRAAPHHHHRKRPRHRRLSQCARLQRVGRVRHWAIATLPPSRPPTPNSHSSTCRKPTADSPPRICSKAITTRSRPSTRRSPVQPRPILRFGPNMRLRPENHLLGESTLQDQKLAG